MELGISTISNIQGLDGRTPRHTKPALYKSQATLRGSGDAWMFLIIQNRTGRVFPSTELPRDQMTGGSCVYGPPSVG
ncbi:hypothetical protein ATANTOWER_000621 [Ataeniobius toweri]|uniref:Uncharacterized protein n=1 Tax=Ataeniobius toweri TaxID=208326 RepID=A0ABU7ACC9_9TELE|nr:hypothetical protein [Ataeniobius toweri]